MWEFPGTFLKKQKAPSVTSPPSLFLAVRNAGVMGRSSWTEKCPWEQKPTWNYMKGKAAGRGGQMPPDAGVLG